MNNEIPALTLTLFMLLFLLYITPVIHEYTLIIVSFNAACIVVLIGIVLYFIANCEFGSFLYVGLLIIVIALLSHFSTIVYVFLAPIDAREETINKAKTVMQFIMFIVLTSFAYYFYYKGGIQSLIDSIKTQTGFINNHQSGLIKTAA